MRLSKRRAKHNMKKLQKQDGKIAGVCGGVGHYLGIDPTIVRLVFIGLLVPGGLPGIIPYGLLWLVMPKKKKGG